MPEKDLFTETESKDFVCVPKVCKGFCCENISSEVAENLQKLGLPMESYGNGEFRCFLHDKETGLCNEYERRTWYCKSFFCPSASRGFMKNVSRFSGKKTSEKFSFMANVKENSERKEVVKDGNGKRND